MVYTIHCRMWKCDVFDIPGAVKAGSELISGVIDRLWPDPIEEEKVKIEGVKAGIESAMQLINTQVSVIVAEAQGGSWLQRSWRPITMLTFLALVVGRFLGLEAANFNAADSEHLFSLIELGLGGYVIGRSAEKIIPQVAKSLKGNQS